MKNFKFNSHGILGLVLGVSMMVSCSDDNDDDINLPDPEIASLVANDQAVSAENTLVVESATLPENGWLVVHRDNGGTPQVPGIISVPKLVEEGSESDIVIELEAGVTVEDGETLWIMMHHDDGVKGSYEFDGSNGLDMPLRDKNDNVVNSSIVVSAATEATASIEAEDQEIMDNTVVVNTVTLQNDGWVVIHTDEDGSPLVPDIISVPLFLEAGTHENVEVELVTDVTLSQGDMLWIMLHNDTGVAGEYEFDGVSDLDPPLTDTEDQVISTTITVQ